jgi:hypothetical protein
MKTLKTISILFLSLITFYSCNDADLNVDNADGNLQGGGLLDVKSSSINYVVGNPGPYTAKIRVYQGETKTTSIRIAKTFYSGNSVSNTVDNFKTVTVSSTNQNSEVSYSFDFSEMVAGLTVDGSPLSTSDGDYLVGDYWVFEYYTTTTEGERKNYSSTKTTVSTRFAGTYNVVQGDYWRMGVPYVGYSPAQVVIESVNSSVYKHIGISAWLVDGGTGKPNDFFFTVDSNTGAILIMDTDLEGNGNTLNNTPIITCENFTFLYAPCSNMATKNDITGEDILEFTVGYATGALTSREFYEKLQKVVD